MYELIIKILGEKDYRKYTIQELEEMKIILEQFKETEEVRLRKIEDKVNKNNQSLWIEEPTKKTTGRSI